MKAWIFAVGAEMLTPFRIDTNSLSITERLNGIGYDVRLKVVVGDDVDELAALLTQAIGKIDLLICTGGLGPTADDVTRDALASVLGAPLELHQPTLDRIRARFERRGMKMPEINSRQAMVPRGASIIENPNGTAPGLWMEAKGTSIALLPGPPREMNPMIEGLVSGRLGERAAGSALFRRVLKITGRTESDVDAHAEPIYRKWVSQAVPISTTILAVLGQIELHLTAAASGREAADRALDAAVRELSDCLGQSVYSVDGQTLEAVVGNLLRRRQWRIAAAESCTGGLLLSRLTDVPGSSDYVDRGVVCYSNEAKTALAGVPASLIDAHGAVSEPVARALAEGIRSRAAVEIGVGITGIAGPTGGTVEKPIGTVAIAAAMPGDTAARTFQFIGSREQVKYQATQAALNLVRLMLNP